MEWVQFLVISIVTCYPFYVVGVIACFLLWLFTKRLRGFPQVLLRSFSLALLLAPGVVIGHGVFPVPAALAVWYDLERSRPAAAIESAGPILVVWFASAVLLFVVRILRNRSETTTPDDTSQR